MKLLVDLYYIIKICSNIIFIYFVNVNNCNKNITIILQLYYILKKNIEKIKMIIYNKNIQIAQTKKL